MYFATRVDCAFLIWESLDKYPLQKHINLGISFIQVPLIRIVICEKSIDGMS